MYESQIIGGVCVVMLTACLGPPSSFTIVVEDAYVPGEDIGFSLEGECHLLNLERCWAGSRAVAASGAIEIVGGKAVAGQTAGRGLLEVAASWRENLGDEPTTVVHDSVVVEVALPDEVTIESPCHDGLHGDRVPIASDLAIRWELVLDGDARDGWLASNPLTTSGLELVTEALENRSAVYRAPSTSNATLSLTSTSKSTRTLRTYDPTTSTFDVDVSLGDPLQLEDPHDLDVSADLASGDGCIVPAVNLTSRTPAICQIEAPAHLLATMPGTCEIEATLEGTSFRKVFTFEVVES